MITLDEFVESFAEAYHERYWPPPLKKRTGNRLALAAAFNEVIREPVVDAEFTRLKRTLGSLVTGQAAERAFEQIYATDMQTSEVELVDDRTKHTDADYILKNGQGKPLYRLNIKLHGSVFRQARERVGLEPEDCFPLATYKISFALRKQNEQHLPYLFVVVTVPGLTAERVGGMLPSIVSEGVWTAKRIITSGKRQAEELFIEAHRRADPGFYDRIDCEFERGRWFIFSARRAHEIMKERLFERVFALEQRGFNKSFKNAEIDMHLSFSNDMMPVKEFLAQSKKLSAAQIYSMIERGTI
jgi:hypothetical protein